MNSIDSPSFSPVAVPTSAAAFLFPLSHSSTPVHRSVSSPNLPLPLPELALPTNPSIPAAVSLSPLPSTGRLLIVSNRLPVSITPKKHTAFSSPPAAASSSSSSPQEFDFIPSSGGLSSALKSVSIPLQWIGCPGIGANSSSDRLLVRHRLSEFNCIPVFIDPLIYSSYYNYSSEILWPLFHYIPLSYSSLRDHDRQFKSFEAANEKFAKEILRHYKNGDTVWIHDYHLCLLPSILRTHRPNMRIGYFLHTPFPSSEFFRVLPSRTQVLLGLLSANLIGFQTHDYTRHFQSSCTRILGASCIGESVKLNDLTCSVGSFPIGIEPQSFINALESPVVKKLISEFEQKFVGQKIFLGIDRLDGIKGIPHKLFAFERFLEENPQWRGKTVLIQIAVPSRTDVAEYQKLQSLTHEHVARINGCYGSLLNTPIILLDQSVSFEYLTALYRIADCLVISSVRDGMNLVAYEYVACQIEKAGVLILSEFAGATQSLGAGALAVNPWAVSELSGALLDSLTMSLDERRERHNYIFHHVMTHTATHWAESFVASVESQQRRQAVESQEAARFRPRIPVLLDMEKCTKAFAAAKKRIIICGLAGTLLKDERFNGSGNVNGKSLTSLAQDRAISMSPSTLNSIRLLSNDPATIFVCLSSRGCEFMDALLGREAPGVWQLAENGFYQRRGRKQQPQQRDDYRSPSQNSKSSPWQILYENVDSTWKMAVMKYFQYYTERTPRSFVKEETTHISWNYRESEKKFAQFQAHELCAHLVGGPLSNTATEVLDSGDIVHVRPLGVSKGSALKLLFHELSGGRGDWIDNIGRRNSKLKPANGTGNGIAPNFEECEATEAEEGADWYFGATEEENIGNEKSRNQNFQSGSAMIGNGSDDEKSVNHRGSRNSNESNLVTPTPSPPPRFNSAEPFVLPDGFSIASNNNSQNNHSTSSHSQSQSQSHSHSSHPHSHTSNWAQFQSTPTEFILCIGNFLTRDEDLFTLLNEQEDKFSKSNTNLSVIPPSPSPSPSLMNSPDSIESTKSRLESFVDDLARSTSNESAASAGSEQNSSIPLSSRTEFPYIFTCAVGKKISRARTFLPEEKNVQELMDKLAATCIGTN